MDNHQLEEIVKVLVDRVDSLDRQVHQLKDDRLCRESAWGVDDEGDVRSIADLWDEDRDDYDWS